MAPIEILAPHSYSTSFKGLCCTTPTHRPIWTATVTVAMGDKKRPQIARLKPPMCWTNLLTAKHNANPLNILVHLQLLYDFTRPIKLKCCSICYRSAVIWRLFWDSQFWKVRRVLRGCDFRNRKPTHGFPMSLNSYKVFLYLPAWPEFQCQIIVPPPIRLPFGG